MDYVGKKVNVFLSAPLIVYLLIIAGLLIGSFAKITPEAIKIVVSEPAMLNSFAMSMATTCISTFLSLIFAIPAGYVISRHRFWGYDFFDTLLDLPIVLPPLVMGLSVLVFFNTDIGRFIDRGLVEGISANWGVNLLDPGRGLFIYEWRGIILVQFIVGCAFAIRVIKSGFDSMDQRLEQIAMTLGAPPLKVFFKVVLPNAIPYIVAGAVISWARIFGMFGAVILVAGTLRTRSWASPGTEIMPTTIFLEASIGRIEVAMVVGAAMVLISMTMLVIFKRLGGKGYLW